MNISVTKEEEPWCIFLDVTFLGTIYQTDLYHNLFLSGLRYNYKDMLLLQTLSRCVVELCDVHHEKHQYVSDANK